VPVQCVSGVPGLAMAEVPEVLPVVVPVSQPVPVWLGGEPVVLGEQMPRGLPEGAARQLAAVLADQRQPRRAQGRAESRQPPATLAVAGDVDLQADVAECQRLVRFLEQVPDRRARRGRRHRLSYVLAVAVVATAAGEPSPTAMGEWAATAPAALLARLGAQTGRGGGPRRPDRSTITRALAATGDDLDRALCGFLAAVRRTQGGLAYRSLHVDGKAVKKAAGAGGRVPMLLSARADDGTVAAQLPIEAKTNEIPMFAPLLDRIDDITGAVITGDQLHTQRAHATYLHARGAHYIFTVGENQPNLYAAADALPWQHIATEHATIDRGHAPYRGPHHQDPARHRPDPRPVPTRRTDLPARTVRLRPRRHPPGRGSRLGDHQPDRRPSRPSSHRRLHPRPLVRRVTALATRRRPRRGQQHRQTRLPSHGRPPQPHHQHLRPTRHPQTRPTTTRRPSRPLPAPPAPPRTSETKPQPPTVTQPHPHRHPTVTTQPVTTTPQPDHPHHQHKHKP
jgi:hypothetical protein